MGFEDLFPKATPTSTDLAIDELIKRIVLALVLGGIVAVIYRATQRKEALRAPTFGSTLVMLCGLIAILPNVIGESAARAFSLVGVLSIVRFRTVVEDSRDTAFVIFVVVLGMACGLGNRDVALIGLAFVGLTAIALYFVNKMTEPVHVEADWLLLLRVGIAKNGEQPWEVMLAQHCTRFTLESTATAKQGAALDVVYKLRLKPGVTPMQLLNELNRIEGVQNLELKKQG
ncbi:MAG: DUF4956 domain-containing protein [Gemmataceae bacterium]|nr:DUF4956 domain-containing protein [Gemmataceae bacterium]